MNTTSQIDFSQISGMYQFMAFILTIVVIPVFKEIWVLIKKRNQKKKGDYVDLQAVVKDMSEKLDAHISREKNSADATSKKLTDLEIQTMGNQIITLMHYKPNEEITIENLCKKYFEKGGNGYVKSAYESWAKEKQANKPIRRTVKKTS